MSRFLIDGHVHLHRMFEIEPFLTCAEAHLAASAPGWLLLTEMPDEAAFERLRAFGHARSGWTIEAGADPDALHVLHEGTLRLIVIAGRQITSREGLEVLAVGTRAPLADGAPLAETVARVRAADAVPVLPWGFGKWWGPRGVLVTRLLDSDPGPLCLGDNAGRLAYGPSPHPFRLAYERGIPVLPGSDPLARPSEIAKIGCYGFVLEGEIDLERPTAGLKRRLRGLCGQPPMFGRREALWRFCSNQLTMQIKKRWTA